MEFNKPEDIGHLIEITLMCAMHRLSYDDGGIINAFEKHYDQEMKDAVIEQIKEDDDWKLLLKIFEELNWKKAHPMAMNNASFDLWINELFTPQVTEDT